jgi:hypothetical protein
VTITLDRANAEQAKVLVGAGSISAVIDRALDHLIRSERLRADIEAYRRVPPSGVEIEIARLPISGDLAEDTDWEALYPDDGP